MAFEKKSVPSVHLEGVGGGGEGGSGLFGQCPNRNNLF